MSIQDVINTLRELIAPSELLESGVEKALAAAGNYGAEDVLSESATGGTPWEFPGLVRKPGGNCLLVNAHVLVETTALTPRLTLYLYSQRPTCAVNDNVPNTGPIHADRLFFIRQIDFPALEDLGGVSGAVASISTVGNLPIAFTCEPDDTKIYGILVTRDAITGQAAGMTCTVRLSGEPY